MCQECNPSRVIHSVTANMKSQLIEMQHHIPAIGTQSCNLRSFSSPFSEDRPTEDPNDDPVSVNTTISGSGQPDGGNLRMRKSSHSPADIIRGGPVLEMMMSLVT